MSGAQPKRVLFLGPGFSEVGGAQKRARLLTGGLARGGWVIRAINRAGTLRRFAATSEDGFRAVDIPGFYHQRLGAAIYLVIGCFLGLIWGWRTSVVVAMQVGSQTLLAAVLSLILRKPFVVLTTSSGRLSELSILREGRASLLRRWAIGRAAYVVVQTENAAAELQEVYEPGRIRILPNPVESVPELPLNGAPYALFMGRLSEEKDLPTLLLAWSDVAAERPGATLTLLGEGGHFRSVEPLLREMVERDPVLQEAVEMKGWVADPLPYLKAADVFVFPSLSEGMSNSLLEACAASRVVVASAIPSNLVILGPDYPLLFPPGDKQRLGLALNDAFDHEDKRRQAVATVNERRSLFSVEHVLAMFNEILLEAGARSTFRA